MNTCQLRIILVQFRLTKTKCKKLKFQGNPVNKFPLKNSNIEKTKEKNKINEIFFSAKVPTNKIANPKNNDKKRGINIREKGIKPLNISSCVKDIEIQ